MAAAAAAQRSFSRTKHGMPFVAQYRQGLRRELYDLCIQDGTTFELTVKPVNTSNLVSFHVHFAGTTALARKIVELLAGADDSRLESMDRCLVCCCLVFVVWYS